MQKPCLNLSVCLVWAIMWLAGALNAQIISPFLCPGGAPPALPEGCAGNNYSLRFDVAAGVRPNAGWIISAVPAPTPGFLTSGLTLSGDGTLSGPIDLATPAGDYEFNVEAPPLASVRFRIHIDGGGCAHELCACQHEFAFVLDQSGSMDEREAAGDPSKWEMLRTVMGNILPALNATGRLGLNDRWGVILFEGTNANIFQQGNFGAAPAVALPVNTGGGTPMAGGIQRALMSFFNGHEAADHGQGKARYIIVLTDGKQNMNPMYNSTLNRIEEMAGYGTPILGAGAGRSALPVANEVYDLIFAQVMAICIGISTADYSAPSDLASVGMSQQSVSTADMENFFNTTIIQSLNNCSPRIVDVRTGVTKGESVMQTESFVVNKGVGSLTLKFTATDKNFVTAQPVVMYNGKDLPIGPEYSTPSMRLFHFEFPVTFTDGSQITSGDGTWSLRFYDIPGIRYELTTFVNEDRLRSKMTTGAEKISFPGDPLTADVTLKHLGQPITDATVEAIFLKPGEDIGDLSSQINVDPASLKPSEQLTNAQLQAFGLGEAKLTQLLTDTSFFNKIKMRAGGPVQILQHQGNGRYVGSFADTKNSGSYRVIIRYSGSKANMGKYQGYMAESRFYEFSQTDDIDLQQVLVSTGNDGDGGTNYILLLKPVNKFGKKLGPGQGGRIAVKLSQGSAFDLTDKLDGTYEVKLKTKQGANPDVSIFVIDQVKPVLTDCLECLIKGNSKSQFGLSLHLGSTIPMKNLNPALDPAAYFAVDLAYRFNPNWSIEAMGGYYAFKPDYAIVGGGLFGVYTRPNLFGPNLHAHVTAGLGVYKPENEDATLGYGLGAGIRRQFGAHLEAGLDLVYYGLPKPDYVFGTAGLAVRYFF